MNNLTYKDIVQRIGYFRNKKNLSARETSLRLGFSDSFINRIERETVELKVSTLLEFIILAEITPQEFFYPKLENYEKDKQLISLVLSLTPENKDALINISKKLK